jgi:hypothetical protein
LQPLPQNQAERELEAEQQKKPLPTDATQLRLHEEDPAS